MSEPELVEEYPRDYEMTQFEKILVAAKRAKDLHGGKAPLLPSEHRFTYVALQEIGTGAIELVYRAETPQAQLEGEGDESDEEE
ncbi:MAG: DNA-directed RNA polymerase subunit omega [Candidatus Lambdaproteobacteria bacterium]|nr:DNA-directed RNA polymerase subunit omega [Candidatus Lambdaproteobacteria bacterium]